MDKLIYFCRYSPRELFDAPVMKTSFAAVRRVEGLIEALKLADLRPYVFITPEIPAGRGFRPTEFKRIKGVVVIIPASVNLKNKFLSYFVNILISGWISCCIQKRTHFLAIIMYNCMPDTILPGVFGSSFGRAAPCIIELEEEISRDNEAPFIFRMFEACARKLFRFSGSILSTSTLKRSVKSRKNIVINGIVSAQDVDEAENISHVTTRAGSVGFIGRLDEMRCVSEFITAVEQLAEAKKIKEVSVVGYSTSTELLEEIKLRLSSLEDKIAVNFHQSVPRKTVVRVIKECEVLVSLVRVESFLSKSFPSKLIEFLLFDKAVVSQRIADLDSLNNFTWIDDVHPQSIYDGICSALREENSKLESSYNGRVWVLNHWYVEEVAMTLGAFVRSLK